MQEYRIMHKLLKVVGLLLTAFVLVFSNIASTKARERPRTIFDMLFGPKQAEPTPKVEPRATPKRTRPKVNRAPKAAPPTARSAAPAATVPSSPSVEKNPDARKVLVVGDFISDGLAQGLDTAFASEASVTVSVRVNGSSGFVRSDHFDWPANIGKILDEEKPAVVVVMMGSNDRQAITDEGASLAARSPGWNAEYQKRVAHFIQTISDQKYPLIWVGQPPFRPRGMAQDMLALNEIYRAATEKAGGQFASVWDGFVDEDGNFTQTGFDINGQTARLRGNDGINLTTAGKRKLAFYAEKPLRAYLGGSSQNEPLPTADTAGAPRPVDRVAPISLRDVIRDRNGVLLGGSLTPRPAPQHTIPSDRKPVPGRSDDFTWPKKSVKP
ncbi:DUF459 domain-containing protein [Brucella sp. BE17]|uniref:DUF459 domain-containing protein n=1 Tax=Brucella sp. BE17 TaxID=3142977 RepID=UPI0031BBA943